MNPISIDDVKKLANLSALSLSDDELVTMQNDLAMILSYVAQLDEVETDGVEPTYSVHGLESVTRDDTIIDYGVSQERLLANAPEQTEGSILVPRVLE